MSQARLSIEWRGGKVLFVFKKLTVLDDSPSPLFPHLSLSLSFFHPFFFLPLVLHPHAQTHMYPISVASGFLKESCTGRSGQMIWLSAVRKPRHLRSLQQSKQRRDMNAYYVCGANCPFRIANSNEMVEQESVTDGGDQWPPSPQRVGAYAPPQCIRQHRLRSVSVSARSEHVDLHRSPIYLLSCMSGCFIHVIQ